MSPIDFKKEIAAGKQMNLCFSKTEEDRIYSGQPTNYFTFSAVFMYDNWKLQKKL